MDGAIGVTWSKKHPMRSSNSRTRSGAVVISVQASSWSLRYAPPSMVSRKCWSSESLGCKTHCSPLDHAGASGFPSNPLTQIRMGGAWGLASKRVGRRTTLPPTAAQDQDIGADDLDRWLLHIVNPCGDVARAILADRAEPPEPVGLYYTMLGPTRQSSCRQGLGRSAPISHEFPNAVASPGRVGYHENGRGSSHPAQYLIAEEDGHDHRRATGDQAG